MPNKLKALRKTLTLRSADGPSSKQPDEQSRLRVRCTVSFETRREHRQALLKCRR